MSTKRSGRTARVRTALMVATVLLGVASSARAQTGTVVGAVTNAATNQPVSGFVTLCTTATCLNATVTATGTYALMVPPGTYVAFTGGTGLVEEIFDDVPCPNGCDAAIALEVGAPFVVSAGATVTRNFALRAGGRITGTVRDAATGAPLADEFVQILTRFNNRFAGAFIVTDASGRFTTTPLGAGTYRAYTIGAPARGHVDEIFGDIPCVDLCPAQTVIASGAPIVVTLGATTSGVDFRLSPGAAISGMVRHAVTSAPLQGVDVEAQLRVGNNLTRAAAASTGAGGTYSLTGLPAGDYVIKATATDFIDEVFDDRPCAGRCSPAETALGNKVTVSAGGTATNVNFRLSPGGSITGTLREAGTGTPVPGSVTALRTVGSVTQNVTTVNTNASGAFVLAGLPTGTYFVLASANTHVTELFGGLQCVPCSPDLIRSSTAIAVTSGLTTTGVDFTMDRAGVITGTVRRTPTNAVLPDALVRAFRVGGTPVQVSADLTSSTGVYSLTGVPAGTYVVAVSADRMDGRLFNGVACPGATCSPEFAVANGTAIAVTAGGTVNNINVSLGPATGPPGAPLRLQAANSGGGVLISWNAPSTGTVATSYVLEAGLASGATFASIPVATTSFFVPGVPPGTYFIRVRGVSAAGIGTASAELTLRIAAGSVVLPEAPSTPSPLVTDGRLTITWTPSSLGPVPTSYLVEVGTALGLSNVAVMPVTSAVFQFQGVPPGYYFVRVRSVVAGIAGPPSRDTVIVAGNVPTPPSEPTSFQPRVAGNVVTMTWAAPTFGPVTSYVLEAGTATGLANITVFDTGSAATSLTVPGVPPGTYFLRLRAVNALGSSPPTFDMTLVVP